MMLIGVLLIGVVIYVLIDQQNKNVNYTNAVQHRDPIEIAKVKLAKGDITTEEYENVIKVIMP
jgi:putative membrane protein